MSSKSSNPPNLFADSHLRDKALDPQSSGTSARSNDEHRAQTVVLSTPGLSATPTDGHDTIRDQATLLTPAENEHQASSHFTQVVTPDSDESDSDTEMADALPYFGDQPLGDDTHERAALENIPNLFRLLDLLDEHGSGGIVEKIVIDQGSLHRLLNIIKPRSYDSVSKINFKSLDKLSVKATGLYGTRGEIVNFLNKARCISDETAHFLLDDKHLGDGSSPALRSGLYFILRPGSEHLDNSVKQAYIVYWPEDTTWNDQVASSSVRRNRVTFMRYLTKLAEQTIALVSADQANAFVWDTGARNKDLPADQMDSEDASRLFSFEVSKSLDQEEDATASAGFTIYINSRHIPKNTNKLEMRLVPGENKAGLMVSTYEPSRVARKPINNEVINAMKLRDTIKAGPSQPQIQLGDLSFDHLMVLAKHGLREKHQEPFREYDRRIDEAKNTRSIVAAGDRKTIDDRIQQDTPMIEQEVQHTLQSLYHQIYPSFHAETNTTRHPESNANLYLRYIGLKKVQQEVEKKLKLERVNDNYFQNLKSKWDLIHDYLTSDPTPPEHEQVDFLNDVLNGLGSHSSSKSQAKDNEKPGVLKTVLKGVTSLFESSGSSSKEKGVGAALTDPKFVSELSDLHGIFPSLETITKKIHERLAENYSDLETKFLKTQVQKITSSEKGRQTEAASHARGAILQQDQEEAFKILLSDLQTAMFTKNPHVIFVDSVEKTKYGYVYDQYRWSGRQVCPQGACTRYFIYPLELTEQDSHQCQFNEAHIPTPKLESRHNFEFSLAEGRVIKFIQLVRDKCLIVVSGQGRYHIYIEDQPSLDQSINHKPGKISINHESLGGADCLFTFDYATRLLAIVHGEKELKLSTYIFDETFGALRSRGSPISLKGWYDHGVRVSRASFVSGTEEICLIEDSGRARIFSLIAQQFRPAALQIAHQIVDSFSAPDGSCLFVIVADKRASCETVLAFHWASFGSNQSGIHVVNLAPSEARRVTTRLEGRGRNHVLTLSNVSHSVSSTAIQVKQKATEFSFHSNHNHDHASTVETLNNSLVDCHLEVWTRFPVVPAVSRCTLTSVDRQPKRLIFQSSTVLPELPEYFARMISTFEQTTRKPMDGTLSAIFVNSATDGEASLSDEISEFLFGSFIVELLCLIPLHLAVTRENRFIPLKDGVWDPAYERSLLGADVPAIIDALSLGWYESLFQSYMATKLVRVVSSMGEQSVGKSYCLNHFADTSFAGSAMRTTEGVWLSCTPTESYLLVSLDFEGVHSIERSAQEDALLVLFNTAVSNLILFRNNFALSRDISGLFTSFQSSAMVLDPSVNKGLFNSTLAIIIKDVTNSDAKDIVKEFSLKFRQIVQKEQDQNFISRLHRGKIQIIPWPVINSPSFYTLFRHLRQNLDQQSFTHGTGGAFLHNLKTLMAKIKAQDWGALDQNLAAHRAQQLSDRLPYALCFGFTEEGPLKNMDTDEELKMGGETIIFHVPDSTGGSSLQNDAAVNTSLDALIQYCGSALGRRQHTPDITFVEMLQDRIYKALDDRIDQVRNWATTNVSRFPTGNQDVRNLLAKVNSAALGMRTVVRICSAKCSGCQLLCLRPYRHVEEEHHCRTDHRCAFDCAIIAEHIDLEPCALPAGHSGTHMCDVKSHSCGKECSLSKMGGCARTCTEPPYHVGDHLCSAPSHLCGKRCELQNAGHRSQYSCPGTCDRPWDEPHSRHACDDARACPIECMLCRRLCCDTDHFHGLDSKAIHLCGQEHGCASLCDAAGICQIETRPSAIQEQFSGLHEAFQYTRYSQVDRRLTCVVPILPGELTHAGDHMHSMDDSAFHYCDTRCPNCEYLCTLPLGHPQQLHETSHGSMTATKWAVKGDDANPVYELQGRKFGSGDEGAPMLCSLVCAAQGRHAHIDFCRDPDPDNCDEPDCEHIHDRMQPEPDRPKDWVSHGLWWARSGFKDPYSQDEQVEFSKCDVMCSGPEHEATATAPANPSFCTLSIFHDPQLQQPTSTAGHVSRDGHAFGCQNPSRLHQAYHIVFVIDSSGSMGSGDRRPLPNTPITARLVSGCNNRYGAVLAALYSFWHSRESAAMSSSTQARQDAYSVITFSDSPTTRFTNDFTSTTDQLVGQLIPPRGMGGTNFDSALTQAQSVIQAQWNSDKAPVVVFLSDGECNVSDNTVYDLCRASVRLGKPLAFYSVSFGSDISSASLRRMADIAHEVYASAPQDVLSAARGNPCAYTNAIDSIQLADTFLGIANSLQKPRASLIGKSTGRHAVQY